MLPTRVAVGKFPRALSLISQRAHRSEQSAVDHVGPHDELYNVSGR